MSSDSVSDATWKETILSLYLLRDLKGNGKWTCTYSAFPVTQDHSNHFMKC